jgi:hypothetical protein
MQQIIPFARIVGYDAPIAIKAETLMSNPAKTERPRRAAPRAAARLRNAEREQKIVAQLNAGVSGNSAKQKDD